MNSALKKLIILGSIGALIGVGYAFDSALVKSYNIEFTSIRRDGDDSLKDVDGNVVPYDCGLTDGETKITFETLLTRNNKPVKGHTMYVITSRNTVGRFITDENGKITFDVRCYKTFNKKSLKDVVVSVKDENNSIFVSVPCKAQYTLKMMLAEDKEGSLLVDDFFFDI